MNDGVFKKDVDWGKAFYLLEAEMEIADPVTIGRILKECEYLRPAPGELTLKREKGTDG